MISRNKEIQLFFEYAQKKAKELGVEIILSKNKFVTLPGIECSGYFDSESTPKLVVATGRGTKVWIPVFVHEFCHMEQWCENPELWSKSDNSYLIDEWLAGKEFEENVIDELINISRELELDCEKRAVKTIKKWKLPIDIIEYTQKSNAYILFYNYLKKVRKWTTSKRSPYRSKKIYLNMSKRFLKDYSKLPIKIEKIFDKELKLL